MQAKQVAVFLADLNNSANSAKLFYGAVHPGAL